MSMFEMGWHLWYLRRNGKQPEDCMCEACREEVKYWANYDYFPLWRAIGLVKPCSSPGSCAGSARVESCK